MECMHDGRWLNDEVINFYLALLLHRELQVDGHRPRVHFHSTFFYNKLFADQNEYNFKLVSRWTTEKRLGYKLLDCDLVVVPVHQAMHWVLAVIDIKQREITYLDSLGGVDRNCLVRNCGPPRTRCNASANPACAEKPGALHLRRGAAQAERGMGVRKLERVGTQGHSPAAQRLRLWRLHGQVCRLAGAQCQLNAAAALVTH